MRHADGRHGSREAVRHGVKRGDFEEKKRKEICLGFFLSRKRVFYEEQGKRGAIFFKTKEQETRNFSLSGYFLNEKQRFKNKNTKEQKQRVLFLMGVVGFFIYCASDIVSFVFLIDVLQEVRK